jgi:hypothetical protein
LLAGVAAGAASLVLPFQERPARAVQGYTPGRIPGIAPSDVEGFKRYTRPDGKMGGHGIGWSEIPPYTFLVPDNTKDAKWEETPVSIADLGGTEVDLRFRNERQGDIVVVLAPVLRFADVGFNADIKIEDLGTPKKLISGFGPEIMQQNVDDLVESTEVRNVNGQTFYDYELAGHVLISMTAMKNRVYIVAVRAKDSLQWKRHADSFRTIATSFAPVTPVSGVALSADDHVERDQRGEYFLTGLLLSGMAMVVSIGLKTFIKSQMPEQTLQQPLMQA